MKRIERDETLPEGAVFKRGTLDEGNAGRVWRLRFDVSNEARHGHVVLSAHARTGARRRRIVPPPRSDLGQRSERERAEVAVALALPDILGCDAQLSVLVAGAIVRRGKRRAGWVGTATLADGGVARVSYCEGEVEAAMGGKAVRARITVPGPP